MVRPTSKGFFLYSSLSCVFFLCRRDLLSLSRGICQYVSSVTNHCNQWVTLSFVKTKV